jgi:hypothetical protein
MGRGSPTGATSSYAKDVGDPTRAAHPSNSKGCGIKPGALQFPIS